MSDETAILDMKVQKRNGQIVTFNESRIKKAIGNSFKDYENLPREVELSIEMARQVEKIHACVMSVLKERSLNKPFLTVEEIQDEVIRQLFENGCKEIAELYANYRKQHAARRTLFELYSITKREGKVVSFKPEKITAAISKAFRAYNNGVLTEDLLTRTKEVSNKVIDEIRTFWPEGRCIHIEEIQDIVEKYLMQLNYQDRSLFLIQSTPQLLHHTFFLIMKVQ